jgi:hypothetical protein
MIKRPERNEDAIDHAAIQIASALNDLVRALPKGARNDAIKTALSAAACGHPNLKILTDLVAGHQALIELGAKM